VFILAIDQGTTSTRGVIVDSSGNAEVGASKEHTQYYPQPGWVEHDPEELIANILYCLQCCAHIEAIGIDNQGESCLAWDAETKEAVTPVIVWQDNRTQKIIDRLQDEGAEGLVRRTAGLPLDSYFSGAKLGWIVSNIPEAFRLHQKGRLRLGTTDAFFLDRLTGRFVTDISTASRTSLMNIETGCWDQELCDLFGVPVETLPEIVSTTSDFGTVEVNGHFVPVRASVVDQQAALYGHGCRLSGDAKITFGTGAFILAVTGDTPYMAADKGLLPTVAWQFAEGNPVFALDGGVFSAASAVNWAKKLGLFTDFNEISKFSHPQSSAIARDLAFVPALTGLGCPHWDRNAGGAWIGLSLDSEPLDLMQALLEGIAFRAAEVIKAINGFVEVSNTISIDGGLSVNPYFCQLLADVLQMDIVVRPNAELTSWGTALLAGAVSEKFSKSHGITTYQPQKDMQQYLQRFQDAVDRTKKWRQ